MPRLKATIAVLSLATAFSPALIFGQRANEAVPGALTNIQGQVNIDGQPFQSNVTPAVSPTRLAAGQSLATANGSAEILLAPGALLRLGRDTSVRMVAGDAGRTEVRLEQGIANVNVDHVSKDHLLLLDLPHGQTQILSPGLYTYTSTDNTLRVFNGQANLFPGADTDADVKPVKVKEGREVIVGGDRAKPEKFDRELAENDLLPWNGPHAIGKPLPDSVFNYGSTAGFEGATYTGLGFGGGYGFGGLGYGFGYPGLYAGGFGPYGFGSPFAYGGYGYGPFGFGGYPYGGYGFGGYYGGGYYGGSGGYYTGSGLRRFPPLKGPGRLAPNNGANGFAGSNARGGFNGIRGGGAPNGGLHGGGAPNGGFRGGAPAGGGFRGGGAMGAGAMRSGGGFGGGGGGFHGGGGGGGGHR